MSYHSMPMKLAWSTAWLWTSIAWANDVPQTLLTFGEETLTSIGGNETVIIGAVQAQNALSVSLDEIKRRDEIWRNTAGVDAFMWDLMRNDCTLTLANLEQTYPFIVESFVMDNQGALVCLSNKTSDYWQGDEAKFTESYRNGQGAIHYGEVEYDSSTDEIMVQISVPVKSENRAVGAITFGISLDRWERR